MKLSFPKSKKFWRRFIGFVVLLPILLFGILLLIIYSKQDEIIQSQIAKMNEEHKGLIIVGDTHLSPFENFPYISIKIDDVEIHETKADDSPIILDVADIYVGFNLRDILKGNYDIQSLLVENGFFNIVLHEDGTNNLQNALATTEGVEESEPLDIHLKKIKLNNLDIHKLDEATHTDVETYIYWGNGGFSSADGIIDAHIDTEFLLNIFSEGDTTYIHDKHFEFHTDLTFDENTGMLDFKPSGITMEHGDFDIQGSIDTKNDVNLDLSIKGEKPNFDMFIAFAPVDIIPILERYRNAGKIYFNAVVQGPTLHGQLPYIDANFGASEAYLENTIKGQRMEDMGFQGHFSTGENQDLSTMEFSLTEMTAKLDKGNFLGSVVVKNFEEPDVDMELNADFDIEFLAGFLNLTDIEDTHGKVTLDMKFHDIIDLDHPERALNDLNQAYFSELKIEDLSFIASDLPVPLEKLDVHVVMNGKEAVLDLFKMQMGNSDLEMSGYLSDLPAIVHHTNIPVDVHLDIHSNALDIAELTEFSKKDSIGIDERIEDFSMGLSFFSSAKSFTESKFLPKGEFFIDSLHAQLKHYPHELHDFHVDIINDDTDLKIVDFTGFIDDSDFHFNGLIHDYGFWMQESLNGDVDLDITLSSDLLRLEDVFSYQGENYVPEDYRHEEFENLVLHVNSSMHYKQNELHSIDLDLDRLDAKMHVHPMKFDNFRGHFHFEDEHLMVEDFHGKLGRTEFDIDMNYYLGEDSSIRKRDNYLGLKANYIDFDQLFNFNLAPPSQDATVESQTQTTTADVAEHAEAFNLYELPFTDMDFELDVDHFIYHRIDLQHVDAKMRTTENHYVYVDTLSLNAAGGSLAMSGYFNGSDPEHIYLSPNMNIKDMDLDKILFKFENFGQDHLVSENLHGKLTAHITGNIRVYPDFVPDLDQSEVHMDVQVVDGKLENYDPMMMLSDYMGNKNLTMIRFDTLQNHIDISNGELNVPSMNIESTLGHMEVSGSQDMEMNMEYYVRIPWKMVNQAARNKIFGGKKTKDGETGDDEIIEVDPDKKVRYLNVKIVGDSEDFKVTLGRKKR